MKSKRTKSNIEQISPRSLSTHSLNDQRVVDSLLNMPDDVLRSVQFTFPSYAPPATAAPKADADGFPLITKNDYSNLKNLQLECWDKFGKNPQINSHVRDFAGRLTGWGFDFTSSVFEIDTVIEEIMDDPRNDLRINFPKYVGRAEIEGELHLMFTVHTDGFIEVDFVDPAIIGPGGDNDSGILFHPTKTTFPLAYLINMDKSGYRGSHSKVRSVQDGRMANRKNQVLVPSINIAYFPDLLNVLKTHNDYDEKKLAFSVDNSRTYKKLNKFYRFIVVWDRSFLTQRNASHIRTTIEWVNYYEELKKYEINHKKSSGAYLWVVTVENLKSFRAWLALSEEDRKETGIMQPKDAGGTLVMPPGLSMNVLSPKLPDISDSDTDIMQMVSSGLNKPQDLMLGDYRSTYASVKASQGPQSDRTYDDLAYFYRFLQIFWRGIFKLRSVVSDFKEFRYTKVVSHFENQEAKSRRKRVPSYKLVEICLPVSKLDDLESTAKALLGTKHGSVVDTLGIPPSEIAKRMGFSNYDSMRRKSISEEEYYPELTANEDAESVQEREEAEPPKNRNDKGSGGTEDKNSKKSKRTK
jgi:hypothetical protein